VCYGASVQAAVVFLSVGQLLPSERLTDVMEGLLGCPMSPGSVAPMVARAGEAAQPVIEEIRTKISEEPWASFDETGLSLMGKTHWLHTASSPLYTLLHAHAKRGIEGIKAGGIIEGFKGRAIHDFLSAYLGITLLHGLCNAHHLRDLRYLFEVLGQAWAEKMMSYLRSTKKLVDTAAAGGPAIEATQLNTLQDTYFEILSEGYEENPEPPPKPRGQRGKQARGKALNLLDRFTEHHEWVMAFLLSDAPFDNNHAERDLRMMKVRQKISGCFRSEAILTAFTAIRSVLATAAKHSVGASQAIKKLLSPNPTLADIIAPQEVSAGV
jgi:transposase